MNKFVIVDDLPYLIADGKTFAVRWDDKGFTVGAEVELASVPNFKYSELSVKAKCRNLDSIKEAITVPAKAFDAMTLGELRTYAKEHDIKLGSARTKDEIITAIADALI